jgi:hypothetical protein
VTSAPAMMSPTLKLSKSGNYYTENKENCPPPSAARKLQPSPQKFGPYSVAQPVQSSNIAQYSVIQQSSGNLNTNALSFYGSKMILDHPNHFG